MPKIISYNVNGIRSAISKGLIDWLKAANPDIVCFQETKAQYNQIPVFDFEEAGYQSFWYSAQKKGYSGVGIITKKTPDHVAYGMGIDKYDNEGRFIRADYGDVSVVSVYHPSGSSGEIATEQQPPDRYTQGERTINIRLRTKITRKHNYKCN